MKHLAQLEVINTEQEFKWRLTMNNEVSPWFTCYESINHYTFSDGATWYVAMPYWTGVFPIETPFQLITNLLTEKTFSLKD